MSIFPCWVVCLEVAGMPQAIDYATAGLENTYPVQWCNLALPSVPSGMNANSVFVDWIEDSKAAATGFSFSTGIRKPFKVGNNISIKIMDMKFDSANEYALSRIIARDTADFMTGWQINKTVLLSSETQFEVTINNDFSNGTPTVNRLYWIRNECVKVTAVSVVGTENTTRLLTVTRGCCGSRAVDHEILPRLYIDSGLSEKLRLDDQPDFDTYNFEATIRYVRIDGAGVPTVKWVRNGYVDKKPKPGIDHYTFNIADISKQLSMHTLSPNSKPVELSTHIRVNSFLAGQPTDKKIPDAIYIFMTRLETELVFNYCIHDEDNALIKPARVTSLSTGLFFSQKIGYKLLVESGGHKFLYRINKCEYQTVTTPDDNQKKMVRLQCTVERNSLQAGRPIVSDGASVSDNIINLPVTDGTSGAILNAGWYIHDGISIPSGIERPKVSLVIWMRARPVEAILFLLLSRNGNGRNHATYDALIGWRGLGIDPSKVNVGAASGSPITVAEDTFIMLQLNELLSDEFDYRFTDKDKFEDFAANIFRLHLCMFGPIPLTGALTMRKWFRVINSSLLLPDYINDGNVSESKLDEKLERVALIELQSGINELDLKFTTSRSVRIAGANQNDIAGGAVQDVRIWKNGKVIDDESLQFGMVHDVIFSFLTMLRDAPTLYSVVMSVEDSLFPVMFADSVQFQIDFFPDKTLGRGASKQYIVTAVDVNLTEGEYTIKMIRDPINILTAQAGLMHVGLKVVSLWDESESGDLFFEVVVEATGDGTANLTTAYGALIQHIVSNVGYMKLVDYSRHNQTDTDYHDEGVRIYFVRITGITRFNERIRLFIEYSEQWLTGGLDIRDTLRDSSALMNGDVWLLPMEYRPASKTPGLGTLSPLQSEGFDSYNMARISAGIATPTFDRMIWKIG